MNYLIADTFTDSLARLTGEDQKAVKTTAFDLQLDASSPGMSFHKLDRARDENFWSVRVGSDIRLIVHKTPGSLMLCYVDHHDKAYDWAAKRKLETHPATGAAQLVEIRETIQEILIPSYVEAPVPAVSKPKAIAQRALFTDITDEDLLRYGVPAEWIADVRRATDDTLFTLTEHLPVEAAEALLELATGGKPALPESVALISPFDHPDAQRRFRVMNNVEELERALEYPWDRWTIFLHPDQRKLVERRQNGPARVAGTAGTGKTVVALHRAAFLAQQNPDSRILVTTFSEILANDLLARMKRLVYHEPKLIERIDVYSVNAIGARLYKGQAGAPKIASSETVTQLIAGAASEVPGHKFGLPFLRAEWEQVVDARQLESWEDYRDVARLGRMTRLPEQQRALLWSIFDKVQTGLANRGEMTYARMFTRLAEITSKMVHPPFDFAIVDESQDLTVAQLRFFAAMARRPDSLLFAGDLGQRIFQTPFSWKSLGVDIRGRSRTLRVNYRTSHQIRAQADRLLGRQVADVDGNVEERGNTISVFNGPTPTTRVYKSRDEEIAGVAAWIAERLADGLHPDEIAVFVRSAAELDRAREAVVAANIACKVLEDGDIVPGYATISTMHSAKGLEFRAVVAMACDDEVIPSQTRISSVGDEADLREVYDTERHLLYVACTRARDELLVTGVEPASEFLEDMRP